MNEKITKALKEAIQEHLDLSQSISDEELYQYIEREVFRLAKKTYLPAKDKNKLVQQVFHSFRGLDVLQPFVDDSSITEIMINSPTEVFIERDGDVTQANVSFESQAKLEDIIQLIVGKVNRVVNERSPMVDARLADGSRVQVMLPPIALKGPSMTIRKFPEKPITMDELVKKKMLSTEAAAFLKKMVQAKYNIFISGGTSSGKTTFLNTLAQFIPEDERIITIEDSAELQIRNVSNLVSLETRNPNTEGKGEITMRDLIKSSLRMRPNRIIVGEVRGDEALDMLQAMNTGHDGSFSTGHANSSVDMLSRLETMVLSGANLPIGVVRKQISSALDIMVHLSRLRDKTRRVTQISEVLGVSGGEIKCNPLFEFVEQGETSEGHIDGKLDWMGHTLQNHTKLSLSGLPFNQTPLREGEI